MRLQQVLNIVIRAVLATPILNRAIASRILVIEVVGRKTGRHYKIPVGYTPSPWGLLIGTAGKWRRNLIARQPVQVFVNRERRTADAQVITDEQQCADRYRLILEHNPVHGRYAGIRTGADGYPLRQDLRDALDRGIAVVQLQPRVQDHCRAVAKAPRRAM